jgi:FG-GAP repeat
MKKIITLLCFPLLVFGQTQVGQNLNGDFQASLFGKSVAISADGSTIAVSAANTDNDNKGRVAIYKNIAGTWVQQGANIIGNFNDQLGDSLAFSSDGSIIALGANGANVFGTNRIYKNISGVWTQIGSDIDGQSIVDQSGLAISISADGSIVAVASKYNSGKGRVRVFKNIANIWTQQGANIDGVSANDAFGQTVSLSADGNVLAIGAPNNDTNGTNSGQAKIFMNVTGTWTQIGSNINGEAASDFFSDSISLSSNGTVVAIGSTGNDGIGTNAGHVRVYKNIAGVWTQEGTDIEGVGISASLSGDGNLLAVSHQSSAAIFGYTKIFKNISGTWIQQGINIASTDPFFSGATALSTNGNAVIIGSQFQIVTGVLEAGQVRVFDLSTILNSDSFVLENFTIYPNPSSEIITVDLQNNIDLQKINIYSSTDN